MHSESILKRSRGLTSYPATSAGFCVSHSRFVESKPRHDIPLDKKGYFCEDVVMNNLNNKLGYKEKAP